MKIKFYLPFIIFGIIILASRPAGAEHSPQHIEQNVEEHKNKKTTLEPRLSTAGLVYITSVLVIMGTWVSSLIATNILVNITDNNNDPKYPLLVKIASAPLRLSANLFDLLMPQPSASDLAREQYTRSYGFGYFKHTVPPSSGSILERLGF